MAQTASTMLPLGTPAPAFALLEPSTGQTVSLERFQDASALLVIFMCNHCPFVQHIRQGLLQFARDYQRQGLAVIAINANDAALYPDDGPESMAQEAQASGYTFPYLYDESQETAKAYRAACTPDFFLFDADRKLVYRGQFDGSRPGNGIAVTGAALRAAADAVLAGLPVTGEQQPSIGCNIKWKPGHKPDYFD